MFGGDEGAQTLRGAAADAVLMTKFSYDSKRTGASFAGLVGEEWDARLPDTAALLAAAVAEERAGLTRAVPSIAGWMMDASRFPPGWIDAVRVTLERVRRQAR